LGMGWLGHGSISSPGSGLGIGLDLYVCGLGCDGSWVMKMDPRTTLMGPAIRLTCVAC